jgi:hypothetical protein
MQGSTFAIQTQASFQPSFPDMQARKYLGNWFHDKQVFPPHCFLVCQQAQRRADICGFHARYTGPLPDRNSFYRIVSPELSEAPFELFVTSPELNFIQMAGGFSLIETIGYGFELCGSYTPQESAKEKPRQLLRLSSGKRLLTYSQRAKGLHGALAARKAAHHVLDNSGSIKETEVAMMLTLPRRYDGFALRKPILNYRVDVDATGKPFVSQTRFYIDMYWPDGGAGLEIDTNKHHSADDKRIKDARRRNSLRNFGFQIVEATQGDISSPLGIAGLGRQLYDLMGVRPSPGQFDVGPEQRRLYTQVFGLSDRP